LSGLSRQNRWPQFVKKQTIFLGLKCYEQKARVSGLFVFVVPRDVA
jgi:hypothetical protein